MLQKVRHPPDIFHYFAFSGQVIVSQTTLHKGKEKNVTLKYGLKLYYLLYSVFS